MTLLDALVLLLHNIRRRNVDILDHLQQLTIVMHNSCEIEKIARKQRQRQSAKECIAVTIKLRMNSWNKSTTLSN